MIMNRMISTPVVISSRRGGAATAASLSSVLPTIGCGGGGRTVRSWSGDAVTLTSWSSSSSSSPFYSGLPLIRCISSSSTTAFSSSAAATVTLNNETYDVTNRFSIQGTFREGQASYLDASATTPLDPRVLDKMMPFMVSSIC